MKNLYHNFTKALYCIIVITLTSCATYLKSVVHNVDDTIPHKKFIFSISDSKEIQGLRKEIISELRLAFLNLGYDKDDFVFTSEEEKVDKNGQKKFTYTGNTHGIVYVSMSPLRSRSTNYKYYLPQLPYCMVIRDMSKMMDPIWSTNITMNGMTKRPPHATKKSVQLIISTMLKDKVLIDKTKLQSEE